MNKLWKNKKVCIALLVICVLILAGVIIGIAVKGNKDETETGKTGSGQDVIVHDTDEDTVEEKAEGGLTESDSEDGPVLNEDNMIDFNGSDAKTEDNQTGDGKADGGADENESGGNEVTGNESGDNESAGNNNTGNESGDNDGNYGEEDNADDSSDENPKEDDEEDSEDTGSWGAFY